MNAIISLTTIPSRAARIEPVLASLLKQGLPVHLWVPRFCPRTGDKMGAIPNFFKLVNWELVDDQGPATKLLPALARGFETILTADDDVIYGNGWADGLIHWAEKMPDAAVAYRGRVMKPGGKYGDSKCLMKVREPRPIDLITGVHGALYRRSFFGESIHEEWKESPQNDDIAFSAHLRRRGVPMMVIPRDKHACPMAYAELWKVDRLYASNKAGGNDEALKAVFWK